MRFSVITLCTVVIQFAALSTSAQSVSEKKDTTSLPEIAIEGSQPRNTIGRLDAIQGTYIFSGTKNEVIGLKRSDMNLSDKVGRQVFAKIPGICVYDMDGPGNQINIAARGLDPHRGWEFNIRKNGIITNSDMFGYPASHYSMPLESIDRIELVRGTASLQYGMQFGGMLNYMSKTAPEDKPFAFESISTFGSYNHLNTYAAAGGTVKKFQYYAYVFKRSRDGYRDNEHSDNEAQSVMLKYQFTKRFSAKVEWSRSMYNYRMAGPQTDSMFVADPTAATRSRNYFSPDIHVPSIVLLYKNENQLEWTFTSSAVLGKRNSVLFDKPATTPDTILASTLEYAPRQVDIDRFNSYTQEFRALKRWNQGKVSHVLSGGIQYMHNNMHRTQQGKGTTGTDYDLSLTEPGWGRDIYFKTENVAIYSEYMYTYGKLALTAGGRYETGSSKLTGSIGYYPEAGVPLTMDRNVPLFGGRAQYNFTKKINAYAGASQAYRSMILKDLVPSSSYEVVDDNINDATGYNAEAGIRGTYKWFTWDVSGFALRCNDRYGSLAETDSAGNYIVYRTNIGSSMTAGLEMFLQAQFEPVRNLECTIFSCSSLMDAHYINGEVRNGNVNVDITGNKVESAPGTITRNGLTLRYGKFCITGLYSYTSDTYADALNTEEPNATGSVGIVPAYGIFDINAGYHFTPAVTLKASVNNLTNEQYFTKRPMFYPGPGVWASDGRNFTMTLAVRL